MNKWNCSHRNTVTYNDPDYSGELQYEICEDCAEILHTYYLGNDKSYDWSDWE